MLRAGLFKLPKRIDQLDIDAKVLITLGKLFRVNENRNLGVEVASRGGRGTLTELIATVKSHTTVLGDKALYVQYVSRDRSFNKSGYAYIPYKTIQHCWLYTGQVTTNQVQNRQPSEHVTIVSSYTEWPYAAGQFPPGEIYSEKIALRWAK